MGKTNQVSLICLKGLGVFMPIVFCDFLLSPYNWLLENE
jgi:hypothetical protein